MTSVMIDNGLSRDGLFRLGVDFPSVRRDARPASSVSDQTIFDSFRPYCALQTRSLSLPLDGDRRLESTHSRRSRAIVEAAKARDFILFPYTSSVEAGPAQQGF